MDASVWRPWARSGEVVEFVDGEAGVLDDLGECVFLDGSMGGDYQLDDVFSSSFLETDVTTLLPYHYEPSLVQGVDHSAAGKAGHFGHTATSLTRWLSLIKSSSSTGSR